MRYKLKDYAEAVGMIITMPLARPTTSQRILKTMGESYSLALRASLARDETPAEWIARVEHELMIEGHQDSCKKCQEDAYRNTPQGKVETFAEWWYG